MGTAVVVFVTETTATAAFEAKIDVSESFKLTSLRL